MADRERILELTRDLNEESDDSLQLSYTSSESSDEDDFGIQPYQFEPLEPVKNNGNPERNEPRPPVMPENRRQHNEWWV